MKHTFNTAIIVLGLLFSGAFAALSPASVSAADAKCTGVDGVNVGTTNDGDCAEKTSFSFSTCGKDGVSISCLVASIMQFMSILVGILVVAGITVGGIVYSTGGGNPGQTKKGVTIITNSVIGLVLYLLMFGIINFLIPGNVLQ